MPVLRVLIVLACLAAPRAALANPADGRVAAGAAAISSAGGTLTVTQSTPRAVIDWQSFDISAGETTRFIQPSAHAIALNRVANAAQASVINGHLFANGQVIVINPNGVVIGPLGTVDVAGFIATTADIDTAHFMNTRGMLDFNRAGSASGRVENQGRITLKDEGLALLAAPDVRNSGVIEGRLARLQLAAGDIFGVDMYGDGLLQVAVRPRATPRRINADNTGSLVTDGGRILMTAAAAGDAVNAAINTSGVMEAKSLVAQGGEIVLTGSGAQVSVAGRLDASGKTGGGVIRIGTNKKGEAAHNVAVNNGARLTADAIEKGDGGDILLWSQEKTQANGAFSAQGGRQGGNGGMVETSSAGMLDIARARVDTRAPAGRYGTWLLDPSVLVINQGMADSFGASQSNVSLVAGAMRFDADINLAATGVGINAGTSVGALTLSGHYIRTHGGDVTITAKGALQANNATLYTQGGDVSLSGRSVSLDGAAIATGGGAYAVRATGGAALLTQANAVIDTSVQSSIADPLPAIPIVITAFSQSKTYGTADPVLAYAVSGTFKQGDTLSGALARAAGEDVGDYAVTTGTLGVQAASGYAYAVTFHAGNLKITPAPLLIAAQDATKAYGRDMAQIAGGFTAQGLVAGDSVTHVSYTSAGQGAAAQAGNYALDISSAQGSGLSNYFISYVPAVLHVTPAPLLITAQDARKVYGAAAALGGAAFTAGTLYNADTVQSVRLASAGADALAQTGVYPILVSGAQGTGLANYAISYAAGNMTVLPAPLSIVALNRTKTYGALDPLGAGGYRAEGLLNADIVSDVSLASAGAGAHASVGSYALTPSHATGTGLGNYSISYVDGVLDVTPAALTLSANNMAKTYGAQVVAQDAGFTVAGLKNDDAVSSVALQSAGGAAVAGAGTYAIVPSSAAGRGLENYAVTYKSGQMTVVRAKMTIAARPVSKTYGDAYVFSADNYDVTGLLNADAVSHVTLDSKGAAASAAVGGYAITLSQAIGTGLANYDITYASSVMHVTPAALTVAAQDMQKPYGQTLTARDIGFHTTALYNGDTVAGVFASSAGMAATAQAGDYALVPQGAFGTGLSNYDIHYVAGGLHVLPPPAPAAHTEPPLIPAAADNAPPATAPVAPAPFNTAQTGVYYYASVAAAQTQDAPDMLLRTPAVLNALAPAAGGTAQGFDAVSCVNAVLQGLPCAAR